MKKDEMINSFGLCTNVIALSGASFYGIYSSYILNTAKTSTLIAMIFGYLLSTIFTTIILKFFKAKPELSLAQKIKYTYSKFSYFINILFSICTLSVYVFMTYRLTSFICSQYLIETSKKLVLLAVLLCTFHIADKGIETTTRVSTLSFYVATFIFLFDIFALFGQIEIDNYLPITNFNVKDIAKASFVFSLYFSVPIVNIYACKFDQISDKDNFSKYFTFAHLFSLLILFLSIGTTLGVLGIELCNIFDYPLYTVLKKISLFRFIESFENVSIMLWVIYIINATSISLLCTFNTLKDTFNLKNKSFKYMKYILFVIAFLIPTIFFMDNTFIDSLNYVWIPASLTVMMLLIVTISLIFITIKNKLNK